MASNADIFATLLYAACEGLPLWNPSALRLGDVGFLRDGSFHVLYNAIDGPSLTMLSDASQPALAMRTTRSSSILSAGAAAHASPLGSPGEDALAQGRCASSTSMLTSSSSTDTNQASIAAALNNALCPASTSSSVATSPPPAPPPLPPPPASTTAASPPQLHRTSLTRSLLSRSASPPAAVPPPMLRTSPPYSPHAPSGFEELRPPLPLAVDQEAPRVFTMGPRTSNNFRALGFELGAEVTGSPVGGTISFETSGGDGALLVPRDPVERTLLKHVGVLKAYIKAHRRWIFSTFGEAEDMEIDEIALVYGQDRTTDWGVSVSRDAARGTKLAFEVFSMGKAGVWGDWRSSGSASQRGPYRDGSQYRDLLQERARRGTTPTNPAAAAHNGSRVPGDPTSPGPMDVDTDLSGLHLGLHLAMGAAGGAGGTGESLNSHGAKPVSSTLHSQSQNVNALQTNLGYGRDWEWIKQNPFPRDQSIILRRITAKNRLGLGFLPARLHAAAGPRREGPHGRDGSAAISPLRARCSGASHSGIYTHVDLLDFLHAILLDAAPQAHTSIASDDDCLALLHKILADHADLPACSPFGKLEQLLRLLRQSAQRWLDVTCDEDGFAQAEMRRTPRACYTSRCVADVTQGEQGAPSKALIDSIIRGIQKLTRKHTYRIQALRTPQNTLCEQHARAAKEHFNHTCSHTASDEGAILSNGLAPKVSPISPASRRAVHTPNNRRHSGGSR
ncbi:hypothetical protein K437DRAFT_257922 [Tilletiaria anomala UBC 951]|uniref:Uncharacterized protein n=1 Tax=Tilletiaria anomala (strain ATCC 24038 / CBS 436.72 / UBC 951) TaxID=1037660 RepID=A0A066VKN0_TILAU|nr:uncharacterized protein K437DRAFT_257922 [Tilletiaria anomala UBC 951]KDN42292.1 hypothetical protein K437DRAFT_257922 [Tilletiaria anomala UBC 951]